MRLGVVYRAFDIKKRFSKNKQVYPSFLRGVWFPAACIYSGVSAYIYDCILAIKIHSCKYSALTRFKIFACRNEAGNHDACTTPETSSAGKGSRTFRAQAFSVPQPQPQPKPQPHFNSVIFRVMIWFPACRRYKYTPLDKLRASKRMLCVPAF